MRLKTSNPASYRPNIEELPNPSLSIKYILSNSSSQCFVAHLIFKPDFQNLSDIIIIIIIVVVIMIFAISTIIIASLKIKEPEPDMQQNKRRVKATIFRNQKSSLGRISIYQRSTSTADH
ncbi:uncharacterized protein EAE97_007292 [Botrytis byssoidea]|uniref:Uncharacterized protein n=1 Tax=Botrytis byssoidea TaxID=139641 RepID=A0A9P5ING5_9HELO|nr:uncharacterized protein EAE97_007292 [Botrytis byssoidea]KAF7939212.1 hypothetical protein EAE97_007292 [Botrytis byssoidea]